MTRIEHLLRRMDLALKRGDHAAFLILSARLRSELIG